MYRANPSTETTQRPGQITDTDLDHLAAALDLAQTAIANRTRWRRHDRY
jgi:hypothetical protein